MNDTGDNTLQVAAPLSGWCATLDDSPDPVFARRVLGDGVSIDPTDNVVRAPFDAHVLAVPDSRHAVNLRADNGAEFLIHVGVDTVGLGGDGFTAHVKAGDRVAPGQELLTFDMDMLLERAASLRTPVILMQNDGFVATIPDREGPVAAGDPLFTVTPVAPGQAEAGLTLPVSGEEHSRSVTVGLAHGIHARPAALLIESIREFRAQVVCHAGNKVANARSAVELMALGVGYGQTVTVVATGDDANAAIGAFVPLLEPLEVTPTPRSAPVAETPAAPEPGTVLRAQAVGTGLAIGTAVRILAWSAAKEGPAGTLYEELQSLDKAKSAVRGFLEGLAASRTGAGRDIAEAHLVLLDDPTIAEDASRRIRQGASAAVAWQQAIARMTEALGQLDDKRLRERVDDLADLNQRVQRALAGEDPGDAIALPQSAAIIAETLLPSQLLEMDRGRIAGICTAGGGTTSHVAILAASMDIPMLVAAGDNVLAIEDDTLLVIDADYGELHIEPDEDQATAFRERQKHDRARSRCERDAALDECITTDGVHIHICANIASVADAQSAVQRGADGSGLLRTEFLFMDRDRPPGLQKQVDIYQQISDALDNRLLVVRTLDAGGDKQIAYIDQALEENPALGVRGIRLSLRDRPMFETQLEALMRVRRPSPLRVMVPMVSCIEEVADVRDTIERIGGRQADGRSIRLGIMIETPAAAMIADKLADVVDFFSIGTNDLAQYTLAMDRGEPVLADRLDTLHPAVLMLIGRVAAAASEAGKPVGVCGGAAGDLAAVPLLVGLGIRELSMVTSVIARQKARLREVSAAECEDLARRALDMRSAREVRAMMREFLTARSAA